MINRRMILASGGFYVDDDNLMNPGSLAYALEAIQVSVYGHEFYPTLLEKAAFLGWRIMKGHVFHDGNKRTGMESCRLMLDINGYDMKIDREVVTMAIGICTGRIAFPEFLRWLEDRVARR
jgi:death-on-curing protein